LLGAIAARGNVRRYPGGTVLITEGDRSDLLYIVLDGRVRVYSSNDEGKEVTIVTHGAGEYIGEMALDGGVRSASVMTLEPTTCAVVSGPDLRHFIETHPEFAQHANELLAGSLRLVGCLRDAAAFNCAAALDRLTGVKLSPLAVLPV